MSRMGPARGRKSQPGQFSVRTGASRWFRALIARVWLAESLLPRSFEKCSPILPVAMRSFGLQRASAISSRLLCRSGTKQLEMNDIHEDPRPNQLVERTSVMSSCSHISGIKRPIAPVSVSYGGCNSPVRSAKNNSIVMKTKICTFIILIFALIAHGAPAPKAGKNIHTKFKARYHRWVAAIYEHPGTLLMSSSGAYTGFPEFTEIVKLGPPALPEIAREIEGNTDQSLFLGEAILKITGWKWTDFNETSLQDLNTKLLKRLREQQMIPERQK